MGKVPSPARIQQKSTSQTTLGFCHQGDEMDDGRFRQRAEAENSWVEEGCQGLQKVLAGETNDARKIKARAEVGVEKEEQVHGEYCPNVLEKLWKDCQT